jgi:hypothetical protein
MIRLSCAKLLPPFGPCRKRFALEADCPKPQKLATPVVKAARKVYLLDSPKRPRQFVQVAWQQEDRNYPRYIAAVVKSINQLSLHPLRFNRSGREYYQEPVASLESSANFVVPLLSASKTFPAVPERNSVILKHPREPTCHSPIPARVRNEKLARQRHRTPVKRRPSVA